METGTVINQYKIISAIGKGGMGEVFLAQDTKLDRKVAIKFLNQEFSKDADKLGRFIQEAKAASALNHPNILTVYEIGETDDTNYIVTELIEGRTLREHLSPKESLQLNQILKIGVQVAEALSAAHQAGIVHRDIKPENIMIRKDGYAKVLDFGLAKLSDRDASAGGSAAESEDATKVQVKTTPGMVMGTVSYMSPEQARGLPTDARTDIWSVGVVLYEMLAGKVPFSGETVNHTIVSILEKEPLLLENIPVELQRIVRKSLTKDVEMRYQSARDLLIDLKNLRRELDIQGELERSVVPNRETAGTSAENATASLGVPPSDGFLGDTKEEPPKDGTQNLTTSSSSLEYAVTQAKSHKLATAVAAVMLVAVISAVGYFGFLSKGSSSKQIESVAVMPFVNESGNADVEYLSDGMTETLISSLSQLPGLNVKPRSSVFRYKGKATDLQTIGRELNVQALLSGRVIQRGQDLSLFVELIDIALDKVVWSQQYNSKQADLVSLQTEIARDVSSKLKSKLSVSESAKVEKTYTANPEAYQLYLKGRFYWNKRTTADIKRSIEYFDQAIALDPDYALAYAGLADAWQVLPSYTTDASPNEAYSKARAAALNALSIDAGLAEPHAALGVVLYEYDWKFSEAEKEFKRAIELNPNYPSAHQWYGEYLRNMGRFDESLVEIKRAQQLDPVSVVISQQVGITYSAAHRYDEAIAEYRKTLEIDPNFPSANRSLLSAFLAKEMYQEAIEQEHKLNLLEGQTPELAQKRTLALKEAYRVAGARGYWEKSLELAQEDRRAKGRDDAASLFIALHQVRLSNNAQALDLLERAFESGVRRTDMVRLKANTVWDPLRAEPRFKELLRKIGLPE